MQINLFILLVTIRLFHILRNRPRRILRSLRRLRGHLPRTRLGIIQRGINLALVTLQKVLQEAIVQELRPPSLGQHRPQQKRDLERVVKRDPVQQEVDEYLYDREEGVYDPVY